MRQRRPFINIIPFRLGIWAMGLLMSSCGIKPMLLDENKVEFMSYVVPQVGANQEFEMLEDATLTLQANLVAPNQQFDDTTFKLWQQRLSYQLVTPPRFGTVGPCFDDNRECAYRPAENFHGEDQIEYIIKDGPITSIQHGVITILVTPVNDPPVPGPEQLIQTSNQNEIMFTLNAATDPDNDSQDLEYHLVGNLNSNRGSLTGCLDGTSNRQCHYQLPLNTSEIKLELQYQVFDGKSWSLAPGKVLIHITKEIYGCTDPLASNFLPQANLDDQSCIFPGCTDPKASNFWPQANQNNHSCIYLGCIDPQADNFDPTANQDNGSCQYTCRPSSRYEETLDYQVEYQQKKINLFFAIDTSGSMSNEITNVKHNIEYFASAVRSNLPQAKIVMMGTKLIDNFILPASYPQNGFFNGIYWHFHYLGSYEKMQSVADTFEISKPSSLPFSEMFFKDPSERILDAPEYPLFIRNSFTHFIFITDDTESTYDPQINNMRLESFRGRMGKILGQNQSDYTIHAIHTQANYNQECFQESGRNYHLPYLQATSQTAGLSLNICQQDWSILFEKIKNQIVASATAISLQECPRLPRKIETVQVSCGGNSFPLINSDFQFINATAFRPAQVIIHPDLLSSKGCDLQSPIQVTINYLLI